MRCQALVHGVFHRLLTYTLLQQESAGNEQLWKPLNHVVMKACEHETRSEVRKAGLLCLFGLMKSLGEEYMVLLPECLPVLSERLEDADEDNARIARECVSLAEELIGESLADNL